MHAPKDARDIVPSVRFTREPQRGMVYRKTDQTEASFSSGEKISRSIGQFDAIRIENRLAVSFRVEADDNAALASDPQVSHRDPRAEQKIDSPRDNCSFNRR